MTDNYIKLDSPSLKNATGKLGEFYSFMKSDTGMTMPGFTALTASPDIVTGIWSIWRESDHMQGRVDRSRKEVVALSVAKVLECPFCLDAHGAMVQALANGDIARAIKAGRPDDIHDADYRGLATWTLATHSPGNHNLTTPPFTPEEAPEIIGTALAFHIINRSFHVFASDNAFPPMGPLKGMMLSMMAPMMRRMVSKGGQPGASLQFVPQADLPNEFSVLSGNPHIAAAFAGYAAIIDKIEQNVVPAEIRELVLQQLHDWDGKAKGISRKWVEDAVATLSADHQPLARIALLSAIAPYQVDSSLGDAIRAQGHADTTILDVASWAIFSAVRQVNTWLHSSLAIPA